MLSTSGDPAALAWQELFGAMRMRWTLWARVGCRIYAPANSAWSRQGGVGIFVGIPKERYQKVIKYN